MAENKNFWTKLGSVRLRKTRDGKDSTYVILDKKFAIINTETNEKVDLGQFQKINLLDPMASLERRRANGSLSEEDFNKQCQFIEEKGVQFELTVPPVGNSSY